MTWVQVGNHIGTSALLTLVSLISLGGCSPDGRAPIGNLGGNGPTTQHGSTTDDETDTEDTQSTSDETDTDSTDTQTTGDGDTEPVEGAAPEVEVLSPEADALLTESVEVTCRVEDGDADDDHPLDVTSIVAQVVDDAGEIVLSQVVSSGASTTEYTTEIFLDDLEPGVYSVGCAAASSGTAKTSSTVDVLLDRGPNIQALTPAPDSALSGAGVHKFEFRISPHELFADDEDAELEGDPLLIIDGVDFTLTKKAGADDVYWVEEVDFNDETVFQSPPQDATQLIVQATNRRGVLSERGFSIIIDNDAPVVIVQSPRTSSIVGQEFSMSFLVQDEHSGINWDSFSIAFGETTKLEYEKVSGRWSLNGDVLTLRVVTNEVVDQEDSKVSLSYQVTVGDNAGNVSPEAATGVFNLDQLPPVLSLDPPTMRYRRIAPNVACSHAFDPAGQRTLNDGDSTGDQAMLRALVLDRTNGEADQLIKKYSMVDPDNVRIYFRPGDAALVVDRNEDGICDDAQSEDPLTKVLQLNPVPLAGSAFFGDGTGDITEPPLGSCEYADPPALVEPNPLCTGQISDLSFIAPQTYGGGSQTAIYAPLVSPGLACTGDTVELSNLLPQNYTGWICVAAVGRDHVGNRGVSKPLALCVGGSCAEAAPTCTASCVAPEIDESERLITAL